jgi:hypothetical protein
MLIKKQLQERKKVFRAVRDLNKQYEIRSTAKLIPLEKPIQTGWKKRHVLRDDCSRRQDAKVFSTILKVIDVPVFCRRKDFIASDKRTKIKAGLKIIGPGEWDNLDWPEHYKKKYFKYGYWSEFNVNGINHSSRTFKLGYAFIYDFYFTEDIQPYFITHRLPKLPEVETRISELKSFITNHGDWGKHFYWKKGTNCDDIDWYDYRERYINRFDDILVVGEF